MCVCVGGGGLCMCMVRESMWGGVCRGGDMGKTYEMTERKQRYNREIVLQDWTPLHLHFIIEMTDIMQFDLVIACVTIVTA